METARALTENLVSLLRREHEAMAEFLVALAEFDRRRVWVDLGHSSLWYFLTRELRLSNAAAQYRKVAAQLIQEIPGIVEPLRRGDLCLTSIIEAAKVVTPENWERVLPRFFRLSRREAIEVVAELQPHPAPPRRAVVTSIRSDPSPTCDTAASQTLPSRGACGPPVVTLDEVSHALDSPRVTSPGEVRLVLTAPLRLGPAADGLPSDTCETPILSGASLGTTPSAVTTGAHTKPFEAVPLTADQSRIHLTVSKGFLKKLEAATDAMSHAMPGATPAEILEAGLELLLAKADRRRGLVEKPRKQPRPSRGDAIPAHLRREVWKRDGGRCQWKLASGGICGATRNLELDHIRPRSMGGASTADNLRVTCRPHNDLAARLLLGDDLMDRYSSGLRGAANPCPARPRAAMPPPTGG